MRNHELYALKQFRHDHGYGLFVPHHCDKYDRVRVGDVGYVTDEGTFFRLFNAFHDGNDPVNRGAFLPRDFRPIPEGFRGSYTMEALIEGHMVSASVTASRVEGAISAASANLQAAVSAKVKFECSTRTGAALIMKYPANKDVATQAEALKKYILVNYLSWLDMVREQERRVELHDLVLVYSCTLTGDWATIVWNEQAENTEIAFNISIRDVTNVSVSYWGQWEDHVTAPRLRGPKCTASRREAYKEGNFDQCIFLKGFRLALREWYQKLASTLTSRITDRGDSDIDINNPNHLVLRILKKYGFKIGQFGGPSSSHQMIRNVVEVIIIFIFENSDANVAVLDDADLSSFGLTDVDSLEGICAYLLDQEYVEVVTSTVQGAKGNHFKVGRLSKHQPESAEVSNQEVILLDETFGPPSPVPENIPNRAFYNELRKLLCANGNADRLSITYLSSGPAHKLTWHATAKYGDSIVGEGSGSRKVFARAEAAGKALKHLYPTQYASLTG